MVRVIVAMTIAAASAALGQVLLRRGMQQIGSLETYAPLALLAYFWQAVCNLNVILGTALNFVFFLLFLAALSWKDVSVVLPLSAVEYVFAALLAILMLQEHVSPMRWTGIILVVIGVVLIARSGVRI
jgi:uncharacterized membrane protein